MKSHSIIEALEEKIAPAGVVLVGFNTGAGNTLALTGDALANNVQITSPAAGQLLITDTVGGTLFKTSVNGATSNSITLNYTGNLGSFTALLGDGSDTLAVTGIAFGGGTSQVTDTTGSGNDSVTFTDVSFLGNLSIGLGAGNDTFSVQGTTFGVGASFSVLMGVGDDVFSVAPTVVATHPGAVSFNMGGGADQLLYTPSSFTSGSITVTNAGSAAAQTISVASQNGGTINGSLVITNTAGNATISVGGTSANLGIVSNLSVTSGTGTDILNLSNATVGGSSILSLAGGTNTLNQIAGTVFNTNQFTFGNAVTSSGNDTVNLLGTSFNVTGVGAGGASAAFNLGEGANTINWATTSTSDVAGNLSIIGGSGNHTLTLSRVTGHGTLSITTLGGNDNLTINSVSATGTANINLGGGTNNFSHLGGNVTFGQFTYGTSAAATGNDTVLITGTSFNTTQAGAGGNSANFHLGAGANSLTFSTTATSNIAGNLVIDGLDGGNTINLQSSLLNTTGSIAVTTGAGNDSLTISSLTTPGLAFNPNLGAGNNVFTATAGNTVNVASFTYGSGQTATGNDTINLLGTFITTNGATLNLGSGTNAVNASGSVNIGGALQINGGADNDTFHFTGSSTVAGATTIAAGNGTNEVTFWSPTTTLGSLTYTGGTGLDVVELGNFETGGTAVTVNGLVNVALGNSAGALGINGATITGALTATSTNTRRLLADEVAIYSSTVGGNVNITLGSGTSLVDLQSVTMNGTVNIDTAAGNDLVLMDQTSVAGASLYARAVTINLGTGDDFLTAGTIPANPAVSGNTFSGTVTINGGTGFDTAYILDVPAVVGPPAVAAIPRGNTFNGGTPVLNAIEAKGF